MIKTLFKFLIAAVIAILPLSLLAKKPKQSYNDPTLVDAPAKAQSLVNPYAGKPEAIQAGKKLYQRHCASCHGDDARGREDAPSLYSPEVRGATPGAKLWFLKNGNLRGGMPAWSRLPDQQLWQLVTFLDTLQEGPRDLPGDGAVQVDKSY
ncbi:MAG: cytochrome c [Terriglobia bacterium]